MKNRIIAAVALVLLIGITSCGHKQWPGRYHHGNNGQSRFY